MAGFHHKGRMSRVDHLTTLSQAFRNKPKKVGLGLRMKANSRLIEEHYDRWVLVFKLGESCQERKEPLKSRRMLVEW
jgi:hypothetical protein